MKHVFIALAVSWAVVLVGTLGVDPAFVMRHWFQTGWLSAILLALPFPLWFLSGRQVIL